MKVLFVASEAQPFAASGGSADVAGSLPHATIPNTMAQQRKTESNFFFIIIKSS